MNTGKRILWIDYAKSICIYLVLLGHAHASQPVTDFIYTFHMPLFFFLSGCLFSFEKHPNFKEFAIKRFKGLMVPYLWINLITYLFWLLAGRNFGEDATISTTWYSPIIGILLGYSKQMIHNTPMWFFICLYFLEIFYYLLFKPLQKKSKSIKISVLIVIAVIGYTNYAYNPYTLPFCLGTAIVGMVFYGIGNLIVHNMQIIKIKLLHIILVFHRKFRRYIYDKSVEQFSILKTCFSKYHNLYIQKYTHYQQFSFAYVLFLKRNHGICLSHTGRNLIRQNSS